MPSSPIGTDEPVALAAMNVGTLLKGGLYSLARALACLSQAHAERCSKEPMPWITFLLRAAASRYIPDGMGSQCRALCTARTGDIMLCVSEKCTENATLIGLLAKHQIAHNPHLAGANPADQEECFLAALLSKPCLANGSRLRSDAVSSAMSLAVTDDRLYRAAAVAEFARFEKRCCS